MDVRAKNFLKISILLLLIIAICFGSFGWLLFFLSTRFFIQIAIIGMFLFILILVLNIMGLALVIKTYKSKTMSPFWHLFIQKFISINYPLFNLISKFLKIDREQFKLFFIEINNIFVSSKKYKFKPKDILIITPHCLQNSECKIKITNNPSNCKRCGGCNIHELLDIVEEYGVNFSVSSGGTYSLKIINELKPKFIIAIACERDLLAGIQDVKFIPVIGIKNEKPNGPCNFTNVDIKKVEEVLKDVLDRDL